MWILNQIKMHLNRKVYLVYAFVSLLGMLTFLSGCGTKKVLVDNQSTYNKNEAKNEAESSTTSKEVSSATDELKETKEEANDVTTTTTTKKYNPDGSLNEETQTTVVDKSKKNTTSHKKSFRYEIKTSVTHVRTVDYKLQLVKITTKKRNVDKDSTVVKNVGGKLSLWIIVVLICAAVLVGFVYWNSKKKIF